MVRRMFFCLLALAGSMAMKAQSVYDFTVTDMDGEEVNLSEYEGKLLLIVNTATQCGFTPQYKELERLYEQYQSEGLEILDFPCNQFGEQAPGSIGAIHNFCTSNYHIQFPQFDKIEVNGSGSDPLFTYLKSEKGFAGFDQNTEMGRLLDDMLRKQDADYDKNSDIKWNFTKFLVSKDGKVLKRYEPTVPMEEVAIDIQLELNPVLSTIMARRSIRKYKNQPVEHEKLAIIARCGINAPSGMNSQPWAVRVVEDQQLITDITEVFKEMNSEMVSRDKDFKNMFRNAPNLICVCSPTNGGGQVDAGLLGENMMLAAKALGLGTCCLGGPVRWLNQEPRAQFFLERLNIPEGYHLNFILAVGYPDEQPDARPRDASKVEFVK